MRRPQRAAGPLRLCADARSGEASLASVVGRRVLALRGDKADAVALVLGNLDAVQNVNECLPSATVKPHPVWMLCLQRHHASLNESLEAPEERMRRALSLGPLLMPETAR